MTRPSRLMWPSRLLNSSKLSNTIEVHAGVWDFLSLFSHARLTFQIVIGTISTGVGKTTISVGRAPSLDPLARKLGPYPFFRGDVMKSAAFCLVFCCGPFLCTAIAYQDDVSKSLPLLFFDDFSKATSGRYNVEGPAEGFVIEGGTLRIAQGVKASRVLNAYQSLLVEFDLRLSKEVPENGELDFAIGFPIDSLQFRCKISRFSSQPPGAFTVAFTTVNNDGSLVWSSRTVGDLSNCEGHWRMACENGRLVVERDGNRLFQFLTSPRPLMAFSRLEIQSNGVPVHLDSLACHGQKLSAAERNRLRIYAENEGKIALARAASADHRHLEAIQLWRESLVGWPLSDERTASVAFIQMEAGLAEISGGNVTDGMSRLESAWPSLSRATPADHPWHIAGEALLREAHQRLKGRTPLKAVQRTWDESFVRTWKAWADVSWKGKTSLEAESQNLHNRWEQISKLKEEELATLERMQTQYALAQATFVQGDVRLALRQAQEAIRQLRLMLDNHESGFSFLEEELGDLLTLDARCQFLLANLDLKELDRKVRSVRDHWAKSLPDDHPKRLVADHNVACIDYLRGNWLQSASSLRKTWQQAKALIGESAPETLETQAALGMLLGNLGEPSESEKLRIDALWRYAEVTTAGWLPIGPPTIEAFAIREELVEHPSLIMFFSAPNDETPSADPLAFHADSLMLARLACRVNQLAPELSTTLWNGPSFRAVQVIEKLAPADSPLHMMSKWLGYGHFTAKFETLPNSHPWRVWLQRRGAVPRFNASASPPASPITELDEFRSASLQQLQSALQESIAVFGENHPETAWCHEVLAIANYRLGRLDEAKSHSAKSAEIFGKNLDSKHYRTLAVRNTEGIVEYHRQNLAPAFEILQQNARDRREVLGDSHLETLRSLSDVAVVARSLGRYDVARRLIEQAIERWPQSDASLPTTTEYKEDIYRHIALVNRAVLQAESGDYTSAEVSLKELLHDDLSPNRREILLSLSSLSIMKGDFNTAESYLLQAQAFLRDRQFPIDDPQVDHSLGVVYRELGQLMRSREYLDKALRQRRESQFGAPYELGDTLTSMGILEQKEGHLVKALQFYTEAASSYVKRLGPIGLRQADSLRRIALAAHLSGNHDMALLTGEAALKLKRQLVDTLAPSLSEAETLLFANTLTELEPLLSALSVDREKNAVAALQSVWQRKAIVTHLLERRRVRLQSATDPEVRLQAEQLRAVRSELATLLGPQFVSRMVIERAPDKGNGGFFDPNERLQRIQQLTTQKESMERSLAGQAGNDERPLDPTLDAVAQGMKRNTALIEFVKVNIWPRADDDGVKATIQPDARYLVFVLHKDAVDATHLDWHDLGPVTEIDPLVTALRRFIHLEMQQVRGLTITDEEENVLQNPSVYEQLSKKLSAAWIGLTSQCKHLYIVPDGMLHGVPWGAMPGNTTKYLIEETSISLLSRGPELLSRPRIKQTASSFLLVGDVVYGQLPESTLRPNWQTLQGTRTELLSIRSLVSDRFAVARLENDNATEAATVESMRTASVAHFATHGFFTPDRLVEASLGTSAWRDPMLASAAGRNPLSRCGVVLADANHHLPRLDAIGIPYGSDGLLTGEELCDLDLRDVGLVVLSACETGLGQITDNEGTFGLHRALSRAGVEASIGSLWKVSDDATTELMTEFYRNLLLQNDSVADALRKAQLTLLQKNRGAGTSDFAAPFFWAAFVVSGNSDVKISGTEGGNP